jgi:hypothetical protein
METGKDKASDQSTTIVLGPYKATKLVKLFAKSCYSFVRPIFQWNLGQSAQCHRPTTKKLSEVVIFIMNVYAFAIWFVV